MGSEIEIMQHAMLGLLTVGLQKLISRWRVPKKKSDLLLLRERERDHCDKTSYEVPRDSKRFSTELTRWIRGYLGAS